MVVDDELGVHARLALHVGMLKIGIGGIASIERAKTAEQAVRNEFDVAPRRNAFETGQSSSLTEPALDPLRDVRPERIFSLPRNAAVEDDSPLLHISRRKAQALEGNRHQHDESLARGFAVRIPHRVERSIEVAADFVARGFGPDGVPLHAQRSGLEGVGSAAVVKGVEHHLDLVVVVDVFTARHSGAHFRRIVEAHEHDV